MGWKLKAKKKVKACKVDGCAATGVFGGLCGAHDALGETIIKDILAERYKQVPPGDIDQRAFPGKAELGNLYWVYYLETDTPAFCFPHMLILVGNKLRFLNVGNGRLLDECELYAPGIYVTLAAESKGRIANG